GEQAVLARRDERVAGQDLRGLADGVVALGLGELLPRVGGGLQLGDAGLGGVALLDRVGQLAQRLGVGAGQRLRRGGLIRAGLADLAEDRLDALLDRLRFGLRAPEDQLPDAVLEDDLHLLGTARGVNGP